MFSLRLTQTESLSMFEIISPPSIAEVMLFTELLKEESDTLKSWAIYIPLQHYTYINLIYRFS